MQIWEFWSWVTKFRLKTRALFYFFEIYLFSEVEHRLLMFIVFISLNMVKIFSLLTEFVERLNEIYVALEVKSSQLIDYHPRCIGSYLIRSFFRALLQLMVNNMVLDNLDLSLIAYVGCRKRELIKERGKREERIIQIFLQWYVKYVNIISR